LMLADPEDEMKLGDFIKIFDRKSNTFTMGTSLLEALNTFKKGKTHLALVREMTINDDVNPRCELRGVLTLEDVVEEILQEEIVDETDVYVDVDKQVIVNDGREKIHLNLEVFNPVWMMRQDRLSREEVVAIAAHLGRIVFTAEKGLKLDIQTIEWLITGAIVQNRSRDSQPGVQEPNERDCVYRCGTPTDHCMLVLQGRLALRVGREGFRSEAGAFSVLATEALRPDQQTFLPDFSAFLGTPKVRFLLIAKAAFKEAQALDLDPHARDQALLAQAAQAAGEVSRHEARELQQLLPGPVRSTSTHSSGRFRHVSLPADSTRQDSRHWQAGACRSPTTSPAAASPTGMV